MTMKVNFTFRINYMLKSASVFLSLVVGAIVLQGCNTSAGHNEDKSESKPVDVVAEKITLKKDTLVTYLTIPGELVAYQQVDLYAKVTGFVKELKVDIGSKVKAGDVLMTLEAPELMSQLSGSESRLRAQEALVTASQANYNRLVETSKTPGTISQNDL